MIRRALLLALFWGGGARAQSPVTVRLDDAGPGAGPALLVRALAAPHTVIGPRSTSAFLSRDSTVRRTVIALGRDVTVEGSVTGDVIVIAGDLHIRPGARVSGRAVAIGGGVYESALAHVNRGVVVYRDFTYDVAPVPGGFALRYRSLVDAPPPTLVWPGIFGIRLPSYDRSNGLSVPVAPRISVPKTQLVLEPRLTYRSQRGVVEPSGVIKDALDSRTTLRVTAGRSTFSNDDWIWNDLVNSGATLLGGDDARNRFLATRVEATVARTWESPKSSITPFIGGRWESDRSVRPDSTANGGPWSFEGRHNRTDMLRANPRIDDGTISSALAGARIDWDDDGTSARLDLGAEYGRLSALLPDSSTTFLQTTLDGFISFPTFGAQSLRLEGHAVVTLNGTAPRQRWAYVGGAGTLVTLNLLSRGGDQLIFLDARYNVPISGWGVPFVGAPVVSVREILAGGAVGGWPSLAQGTGLRVALSVAYVEFLVDPAHHRGFLGAGLAIAR